MNPRRCTVTLDVDFKDLVAPGLWRFIQTDAKAKFAADFAKPKSIEFKSLSFEIKYEATDPKLAGYDVVVSDKPLTLEPRIGTPIGERRFYTSSPTDSETHLSILKALEETLANRHRG